MKLSFSTRGWSHLSWEECLDIGVSMDFEGIEVYNLPKFPELMERLVRLALKRKREASAKTVSYDQNIFSMGAFAGAKGSKGTKA